MKISHHPRVARTFCNIRIAAQKLPPKGYPSDLCTVGDHLRKMRMDRKMSRGELAHQLGVKASSVPNWELGNCNPRIESWPAILKFLGYYPEPDDGTIVYQINRYQRYYGIQRLEFARRVGLAEETIRRIENGGKNLNQATTAKLQVFLDREASNLPFSYI